MSWLAVHARRWRAVTPATGLVRWLSSNAADKFQEVTASDIQRFQELLGPDGVVTSEDRLESYRVDWMRKYRSESPVALLPRSTREVASVLRHCSARNIPVVPQGGNTGLVGGSVGIAREVTLSLSRMNQVVSIDESSGIAVVEAGVVLQHLEDALAKHGLAAPVEFGARGSCQLGGMVATNAGGMRVLRYGSLQGCVLGLVCVLADGEVVDLMGGGARSDTALRKDNTGFALKNLLIGSEGTLAVVTRVALLCPPAPASHQVALLACPTFDAALGVLRLARRHLGEILASFEFFDAACADVTARHGVQNPLAAGDRDPWPVYLVVETHGAREEHDREKLEDFLGAAMEDREGGGGLVGDGVMAEGSEQADAIWALRERITESMAREGRVYKYDVSLPPHAIYQLVEATRARVAAACPGAQAFGFGHLGDGNLHLNVVAPQDARDLTEVLEPWVYEQVRNEGGSISAEHGLGRMKRDAVLYSRTPSAIAAMARVKRALDPQGLLNPGKVLPEWAITAAECDKCE
ncbi:unnamed protein product [Pedinophyceae sp. YPF-701]|nr:unnamed protein product [Pedinophyceae sp. YPF-701]